MLVVGSNCSTQNKVSRVMSRAEEYRDYKEMMLVDRPCKNQRNGRTVKKLLKRNQTSLVHLSPHTNHCSFKFFAIISPLNFIHATLVEVVKIIWRRQAQIFCAIEQMKTLIM
jgi:hypothetical protein